LEFLDFIPADMMPLSLGGYVQNPVFKAAMRWEIVVKNPAIPPTLA
jgi:hypothetical protein